jgi:hypothetical protein
MNIVTQSNIASRLLERFDPHRPTAGASIDVGCVDWYLYPVNPWARRPEDSSSVLPGVAAAAAGESPSA